MECSITVVVPAYNVEQYLSKCLDSILAQDFENFEIIIVNDGSTDHSLDIAKEYEENYPDSVRVISQLNKGLGGARNTGIKNAKGKYILFVDSDDMINPNMFTTLYNEIVAADADMIFFGIEYIDENGKILNRRTEFNEERLIFQLDEQPYIFAKDSYIWDKMYKTSLFRDNNIFFPERSWYEDLKTGPKIILHAKKMIFVKKIFYKYLQRQGSIMHNSNVDKNIDMIYAVEDVINYYKTQGAFEKFYDQLEFLTIFHVMTLCTLRVASDLPGHPLLKQFYDFTEQNFPGFKKSKTIKELSPKYRVIFKISVLRQYWLIWILNKMYRLVKR